MARANAKGRRANANSYRPWFDRAVFGLGLLGILVAIHLVIQENRGFDRGCLGFTTSEAVEASFDCAAVTQSAAGSLLGLPNGVWGVVFFLGIVGFTLGAAVAPRPSQSTLKNIRFGLVGVGVLYAGYLSYVQAAVLEEYCALCLIVSGLVGLLAIVHVVGYVRSGGRSAGVPAGEVTKLASGLGLVLVLAGANVAYFQTLEPPEEETTEVAQATCDFADDRPTIRDVDRLIGEEDTIIGNPDAAVTILEFFDPNCPHCKTSHGEMKKVLDEYGDEIRLVYKPVVVIGQQSVPQIAALYVAQEEGVFEEMLSLQFEMQQRGGLSMGQLRQIGEQVGLDPDELAERMQQDAYLERMQAARETALEDVGISGVPAIFIDGYFVPGQSRNAECITELVANRLASE